MIGSIIDFKNLEINNTTTIRRGIVLHVSRSTFNEMLIFVAYQRLDTVLYHTVHQHDIVNIKLWSNELIKDSYVDIKTELQKIQ